LQPVASLELLQNFTCTQAGRRILMLAVLGTPDIEGKKALTGQAELADFPWHPTFPGDASDCLRHNYGFIQFFRGRRTT
jgi:hypothetical protein